MGDWKGFSTPPFLEKRYYSKTHRKEFVETHFLERLGEDVIEGIAKKNPRAYEVGIAIIKHLQLKLTKIEGQAKCL